jgi:hypothetical protein
MCCAAIAAVVGQTRPLESGHGSTPCEGGTYGESGHLGSNRRARLGGRAGRALVLDHLLGLIGVNATNKQSCAGGSRSDVEPHYGG